LIVSYFKEPVEGDDDSLGHLAAACAMVEREVLWLRAEYDVLKHGYEDIQTLAATVDRLEAAEVLLLRVLDLRPMNAADVRGLQEAVRGYIKENSCES